jgi:hypothetical protein
MNEDRYIEIEKSNDYQTFMFVSQGRHGNLAKIVSFDEIVELENVFNLSLGTILPDGKIDFETITNNGDRNKVLTTVVGIVVIFIEKHPGKNVYFAGSDDRRTLLYQRAIAYGYDELTQTFNIYGDISIGSPRSVFERFDKEKSYRGFLIKRK